MRASVDSLSDCVACLWLNSPFGTVPSGSSSSIRRTQRDHKLKSFRLYHSPRAQQLPAKIQCMVMEKWLDANFVVLGHIAPKSAAVVRQCCRRNEEVLCGPTIPLCAPTE